jgi:D-alanine-D-alanine ligase
MKRLHIALIYNAYQTGLPELPEDRAGLADLRRMIRLIARTLRSLGHTVTVLPLACDLFAFQRRLLRLRPDVVFNQYDDVVHGALYEMRVAALVRMMGFPLTGSPALALGLSRYKFMAASLLAGAGIPIPPNSLLVETVRAVRRHKWQYPLVVQPSQEHGGVGLDRDSLVFSQKALALRVREILRVYNQPALVQHFLPGREFNVGIVGGSRPRVLPLAEVDYSALPAGIPPIFSYAAKWVETSPEYQKTSIVCPAPVEPELAQRIGDVALRAFRAVSGWGYGRVDTRLDEAGQPRVLEVNCNPCLDDGMGLARSAEKAGISYPQLLQAIVRAALERSPYDTDIPMLPPLTLAAPPNGGGTTARALAGNPARVGEVQGQGRRHRRHVQELGAPIPAAEFQAQGIGPVFQLGK